MRLRFVVFFFFVLFTTNAISAPKKTWIINGLGSNAESIGYGINNLSKKLPGSKLFNYAIMGQAYSSIRNKITREIKSAYEKNKRTKINLIGFSVGANIATLIAAELDREDIPVYYLAAIEGPAMVAVTDNVRKADSFSCTQAGCFRTKLRLAQDNKQTKLSTYKIDATHIPTGDHEDVHKRIVGRVR